MTSGSILLTLLVIVALANGAVVHHKRKELVEAEYHPDELAEAQYQPVKVSSFGIYGKLNAVGDAFENVVYNELSGLEKNLQVFGEKLREVEGSFVSELMEAIKPLFEACPADVFKQFALDSVLALDSFLEDLESVVDEYNPLHPKVVEELRSLIRRKLTTISTLGGSIGKLFDAVDDLVVSAVQELVSKLELSRTGLKSMAEELENIPAEDLKQATLHGFAG